MGIFWSSGLAPEHPLRSPATGEPAAPPPPRQHHKPPRLGVPAAVAVLLAVVAVVGFNLWRRQQAGALGQGGPPDRVARITAGPFEKSLRVTGTVSAKNYAAIVAPRLGSRHGGGGGGRFGGGLTSISSGGYELILVQLAKPGSVVKAGDVVAKFDNQWEEEHLEDHKARVIQAQAMVNKRKAEIEIETEALQQMLRQVRADRDKATLDLKTAEIRSEIDAEKLKLSVEEASARCKQVEEEVRLKKLSQAAELRGLGMQAAEEQHHVDRHTRNLPRMSVKSPIDGLVVMQSIPRSGQVGQVQEGDQVFPGAYFMQIVDLSQMVVNGAVNQADSNGLALGQRATVKLDAYPELSLPARLTAIGAMASSGQRGGFRGGSRETYVRQIPVRFAIEAADKRVIPDLSAAAELQFKAESKALQIPREAVLEEAGKAYAFQRRGDVLQKTEIQLGLQNNTHAIVVAGLSEGDEVVQKK